MRTIAVVHVLALTCGLAVSVPGLAQEPEALTTVILVRHAEKAVQRDDPPLAREGEERARRLAYALGGLDVDAIYSTPTTRTRQTAKPLADRLGLAIVDDLDYSPEYAAKMATRIRAEHAGHVVVVVGHSNTTPEVARALGVESVPDIPDSDYDNLYVVTFSKSTRPRLLALRF